MNAATGRGQETVRRRRARRPGRVKNRRIAIAVDEVEHQDLEAAAREDGLTVSAFVANRALAAARHTTPAAAESLRESLVALNHATSQLQRAGTNFNQAVAALNATGHPSGNLPHDARYVTSIAQKIDDAADRVQRMLP